MSASAGKVLAGVDAPWVLDFAEVGSESLAQVGGKCANLGELLRAGAPVPDGFAVTTAAFRHFLARGGIAQRIDRMLQETRPDDIAALEARSAEIRALIEAQPLGELANVVRRAYRALQERDPGPVAVRSSATQEDQAGASFAGQLDTYLYVQDEADLLRRLRSCFASLFTARCIAYRFEKGIAQSAASMSVGVQRMVAAKVAGVMFTLDPVGGDRSVVSIEGCYGAGESLAQGHVTPDRFMVRKGNPPAILERRVERKLVMTVAAPAGGAVEVPVPAELQTVPCLTDEQVLALAEHAQKVEAWYERPMDIEWAVDGGSGRLYLLQARPETVWSLRQESLSVQTQAVPTARAQVLKRGLAASPGRASGRVRVILDVAGIAEFQPGEVLVTRMTTTDWLPAVRNAAALITDSGGTACHAAIISRELGLPCVVATMDGTDSLEDGQTVTVDGTLGIIYDGAVADAGGVAGPAAVAGPVTATPIYLILSDLSHIAEYRALPFEGVGLMRMEFIISGQIGEHPLHALAEGRGEEFVDRLAEGIAGMAEAVYPRPVLLRFSDLKTNEYRVLRGGAAYEPEECNPMIGWRGASRFVSNEYQPAFRLECRAIRKVREEMGLRNVHVMLPFARLLREVRQVQRIMAEEGLERGRDFQFWIMAEVPANFILAEQFAALCDGFTVGTNDVVQLNLGVDRDSELLGRMGYFDERNEAVLQPIGHLIEVAHRHGLPVAICGQAPSKFPDFCEAMLEFGADILCVNPDALLATRRTVASAEQRLLLRSLRQRSAPARRPGWALGESTSRRRVIAR